MSLSSQFKVIASEIEIITACVPPRTHKKGRKTKLEQRKTKKLRVK
jgi:hypothetical protein